MAIVSYRVFFDTSVYIAALLSPKGAAGELLRLAEAGVVRMVVCEKVITVADEVLAKKFPDLIDESRGLWKHLSPEIASTPTAGPMKPFSQRLPESDALILCAAHLAKVKVFVTWNTRDFMLSGVASLVDFPIVVPMDCLKLYRKWLEAYLD